MRYLIDGCYGDGNVGDECLLRAVVELVRSSDPAARIAVFSSDPVQTEREIGLPAIAQCNPFSRNLYGSLFKGLLWRTVREISRCDTFILGGGELLRDDVGPTATLGMFHRMWLAQRLRKRVIALGVGAQPATTRWGRTVLRRVLRGTDAVVLRDADSLCVVQNMEPRVRGAQWLPDLVFSLDWHGPRHARTGRGDAEPSRIGVAVKSLPPSHHLAEAVNHRWPTILARALKQFSATQCMMVDVLPFADHDLPLAEKLAGQWRAAGLAVSGVSPPGIGRLGSRIAQLDVLLATPLHASVFAFACGVPAGAFAYDAKVSRLYDGFGVREYCLAADDVTESRTLDLLLRLWRQRADLQAHLTLRADRAGQSIRDKVGNIFSQCASSRRQARPMPQCDAATSTQGTDYDNCRISRWASIQCGDSCVSGGSYDRPGH